MRHHARRTSWVDAIDWPFVAWCLFLLLLISWAGIGYLLWAISVMP